MRPIMNELHSKIPVMFDDIWEHFDADPFHSWEVK